MGVGCYLCEHQSCSRRRGRVRSRGKGREGLTSEPAVAIESRTSNMAAGSVPGVGIVVEWLLLPSTKLLTAVTPSLSSPSLVSRRCPRLAPRSYPTHPIEEHAPFLLMPFSRSCTTSTVSASGILTPRIAAQMGSFVFLTPPPPWVVTVAVVVCTISKDHVRCRFHVRRRRWRGGRSTQHRGRGRRGRG
ncbi:hypothetical protein C8R45DRAFT_1031454 [Mycena sanguinolenta]|nr:hypothetical protein C8R45DRAFT_1031454 [Mycena sanguinolenta]